MSPYGLSIPSFSRPMTSAHGAQYLVVLFNLNVQLQRLHRLLLRFGSGMSSSVGSLRTVLPMLILLFAQYNRTLSRRLDGLLRGCWCIIAPRPTFIEQFNDVRDLLTRSQLKIGPLENRTRRFLPCFLEINSRNRPRETKICVVSSHKPLHDEKFAPFPNGIPQRRSSVTIWRLSKDSTRQKSPCPILGGSYL